MQRKVSIPSIQVCISNLISCHRRGCGGVSQSLLFRSVFPTDANRIIQRFKEDLVSIPSIQVCISNIIHLRFKRESGTGVSIPSIQVCISNIKMLVKFLPRVEVSIPSIQVCISNGLKWNTKL